MTRYVLALIAILAVVLGGGVATASDGSAVDDAVTTAGATDPSVGVEAVEAAASATLPGAQTAPPATPEAPAPEPAAPEPPAPAPVPEPVDAPAPASEVVQAPAPQPAPAEAIPAPVEQAATAVGEQLGSASGSGEATTAAETASAAAESVAATPAEPENAAQALTETVGEATSSLLGAGETASGGSPQPPSVVATVEQAVAVSPVSGEQVVGPVETSLAETVSTLAGTATATSTQIVANATTTFQSTTSTVAGTLTSATAPAPPVTPLLAGVVGQVTGALTEPAGQVVPQIVGALTTVGQAVPQAAGTLTTVGQAVPTAVGVVTTVAQPALGTLGATLSQATQPAGQIQPLLAAGQVGSTTSAALSAVQTISGEPTKALAAVTSATGPAGEALSTAPAQDTAVASGAVSTAAQTSQANSSIGSGPAAESGSMVVAPQGETPAAIAETAGTAPVPATPIAEAGSSRLPAAADGENQVYGASAGWRDGILPSSGTQPTFSARGTQSQSSTLEDAAFLAGLAAFLTLAGGALAASTRAAEPVLSCLSAGQLHFPSVRVLPCRVSSALEQGVQALQSVRAVELGEVAGRRSATSPPSGPAPDLGELRTAGPFADPSRGGSAAGDDGVRRLIAMVLAALSVLSAFFAWSRRELSDRRNTPPGGTR